MFLCYYFEMNKKNFWEKLKKPFFCTAPMADVTDVAFREMLVQYGSPDVFWTEFVSADGLAHPDAREKLLRDLEYTKKQRSIVAQIFGSNPDTIREASRTVAELGFDGVDINMGCPDKKIEKQGAGAALMKNPKLAQEIIRAAKEGACLRRDSGRQAGNIPVSVKARIGYNKNEIETWLPALLEAEPAVITVHGRTRKEMSKVSAHWDVIARAVELRNEKKSKTLIIGNGDVESVEDGLQKARESGVDGVMIGRALFGQPDFFADKRLTISKRLIAMIEHTKFFEKRCSHKNFAVMKKHFKTYVAGFDGAKELRVALMSTESAAEVEKITKDFLHNNSL